MLPSNNIDNIISEISPGVISSNLRIDDEYSLANDYHENLFSSLPYFPSSPFNHYDTDYFFVDPYAHLSSQETITTSKTSEVNEMMSTVDNSSAKNDNVIVDSKKKSITPYRNRSSKKDRHSKIITTKGPRDRRMRLSLEIAREFFGLQDMLGFEKASSTVEWLLTKAEHDIKKLFTTSIPDNRPNPTIDHSSSFVVGAKSVSSISEREVISGIIDHREKRKRILKCETKTTKVKTKHKEVKKPVVRPIRTRDMREKAREKARERTKVKKCPITDSILVEESNRMGSSWTPPLQVQKPVRVQEHGYAGGPIIMHNNADHSFVMTDKWCPTSIFSHLQGRTEEEHHLEDFQVYGKPWDSYNIQNLL